MKQFIWGASEMMLTLCDVTYLVLNLLFTKLANYVRPRRVERFSLITTHLYTHAFFHLAPICTGAGPPLLIGLGDTCPTYFSNTSFHNFRLRVINSPLRTTFNDPQPSMHPLFCLEKRYCINPNSQTLLHSDVTQLPMAMKTHLVQLTRWL